MKHNILDATAPAPRISYSNQKAMDDRFKQENAEALADAWEEQRRIKAKKAKKTLRERGTNPRAKGTNPRATGKTKTGAQYDKKLAEEYNERLAILKSF